MTSKVSSIANSLNIFTKIDVEEFLKSHTGEIPYPEKLVKQLAKIGVFGGLIPAKYKGLGLSNDENLLLVRLLSGSWLSLSAILGSHNVASNFICNCGTAKQKSLYLPKMAQGDLIFAFAHNEKGIRIPAHSQTVIIRKKGRKFLTGRKDWVSNSMNADKLLVSAYDPVMKQSILVILDREEKGVSIEPELSRSGIKGVSVCPVSFTDVEIKNDNQILTEGRISVSDMFSINRNYTLMDISARAAGAATVLVEHCKKYLLSHPCKPEIDKIIKFRLGEVFSKLCIIESTFKQTKDKIIAGTVPCAEVFLTKVICTENLQQIVNIVLMLEGGHGYANNENVFVRMLTDAQSLQVIGTPNDILLSMAGELLEINNIFKL